MESPLPALGVSMFAALVQTRNVDFHRRRWCVNVSSVCGYVIWLFIWTLNYAMSLFNVR